MRQPFASVEPSVYARRAMGRRAGIRTMAGAALAIVACLAAYGYAFAGPANDARVEATGWSAQPTLSGGFADCPSGRRAVGGGVIPTGSRKVYLAASGPLDGSGAGGPLNPTGSV